MDVRRLGPGDAVLAAEAVRTLKGAAPAAERLREFLSRRENALIVAEQDGAPTGFLVAYLLERVDGRRMACLYEIGVAEGRRRRGVGRAMIEAFMALCRQEGAYKAWVITDRANAAAVRLYASTGAAAARVDDVVFVYEPIS